ncbi:hypothetical protein BZG01_00235 [Labilibaculum manganireducens]|uniref:Uncharacterized protein n=1 Tax=Labilibaculum manganireducens TaxID=1940525 RepID=A0A2N3IGI8_9BACT|nr:hypothetical protein [Labilibaculum manganireducens]PKQ69401.1 hypothetical protein BZG01_00235 [Labilibaculum manganireducens]
MTALNISKRKIYKRRRDGQVAQGSTVSSVIASTASSGGVDPVALQDYAKKVDVHAPSQKAFLDALSINSNYIKYNALGVSVENADQLGGVVAGSYARKDVANTYGADQTINADLYINGNIIQNGSAYVTHAEQVQVESNLIQLNLGEPGSQITGVIPGTAIAFSGIEINRGTADPYYLGIVEGANPLIKLGKASSLVTVAAREDNPLNNGVMVWDDANHRMKALAAAPDSDKLGGVVAVNYARTDQDEFFSGSITIKNGRDFILRALAGSIDSGDIVFEDGSGVELHRLYSGFGTLNYRALAGITYGLYHSGNSNLSTVDWKAKNILASGNVGSPDYVSGLAGTDWRITKSGDAEFDNLEIRKGLTVHEIIVARERSVNGGIITSVANGTVKSVVGDVITLKGQYNSWVVGDRVRLQQWEASTRYMEAEVVAVSGMTITLGNYINTTRPQANEDLVQWGHVSDASRQNFLYQTARGADAAYFSVMQGVNSSDLTNKQVLRIGNLSGYANAGYGIASKYSGKTYFELSNNVKTIAGIGFDDEKFTAGNVQIKKTGDIINTGSGTPYAFYGNGNFSLGKGQIGYNAVTNVVTFGANVALNWQNYADSAVDAVQVGGKNNFKKTTPITQLSGGAIPSRDEIEAPNGFKMVGVSGVTTGSVRVGLVISDNGEHTFSFWAKTNGVTEVLEFDFGDSYAGARTITGTWQYFTITRTVPNYGDGSVYCFIDITSIAYSWYYFKDVKIEKGNKATDWTPAPEDVDASIATKITGAEATVITNNTIATTNLLAQNLQVQMANVTGTLSASQIDALSITGDKIASGTITTTKLAALTITAEKIASGTITADKLNVTSVQASLITTDYIEGLSLDFDRGTIAAFSINSNYLRGGSTIGGGFAGVELNANPSDEGYIRMYRDGSNTASRVGITFGIESNHDESAIFSSAAYGEYALGLNLVSQENIAIKSGNGVAISAVNEVSLYAGNNKDIILTGNALFKKQIKTLVLQSAGSTSSTYPTTLNTSDSSTFMLGSTSSNRHYSLTGGTNGQLLILFNRNDTSNCYVRGFIQQSANPSDYFEMVGGEVLVAQYHANSMYNPTRTGYWVVLTRYNNSW